MNIKGVSKKLDVGGMEGYKVVLSSFPTNDGLRCMCRYRRILEGDNPINFPLKIMIKNHMPILVLIKVVFSICVENPSVSYSCISIEGNGNNLIMVVNACKIHNAFWVLGNVKLSSLRRNFLNCKSFVILCLVWVLNVGFSQGRKKFDRKSMKSSQSLNKNLQMSKMGGLRKNN